MYTHRNGETELPTEVGLYWLHDPSREPYTETRWMIVYFDRETYWRPNLAIMFLGSDELMNAAPDSIAGSQWWGPLVPPWEEPDAPAT